MLEHAGADIHMLKAMQYKHIYIILRRTKGVPPPESARVWGSERPQNFLFFEITESLARSSLDS